MIRIFTPMGDCAFLTAGEGKFMQKEFQRGSVRRLGAWGGGSWRNPCKRKPCSPWVNGLFAGLHRKGRGSNLPYKPLVNKCLQRLAPCRRSLCK